MDLLQNIPDRGYPEDYLLSRIRGKRAGLVRNCRPLLIEQDLAGQPDSSGSIPPEKLWGGLVREHRWAFRQMNRRLRRIFHPYFLYAELRTIFLCLRSLSDRKAAVFDELLQESLLSNEIKATLRESADLPEAVDGIENLFSHYAAVFDGLADVFASEGLRAVEQRLVEVFLSHAASSGLHPVLRKFFSRLIDARNIISLAKCLRFDVKAVFPFIPGGMIAEGSLRGIEKKGDPLLLQPIVRKFAGISVEKPDPASLETVLYRSMTRWARVSGREPFGPAPILDYLWRCSIQTMNMSILSHGTALEREVVGAELVQ